MIDFHTHLLPGIDDGSKTVEESVEMLTALGEQGVDIVAATPHFYPTKCGLQTFLERRQSAFERLRPHLTEDMPSIRLGAEVAYYPGISRMADLPLLCLEGSQILLLEMPARPWTDSEVRELVDLSCLGRLTTVLAHIERYPSMRKRTVFDLLLDRGILMQGSVGSLLSFTTRRRTLTLLLRGRLHLFGTDCHNMTTRPPRMGEAIAVLQKRLGGEFLRRLDAFGRSLLK